ncbi:MAG TPA: hypothetical protein VN317_06360, partial [Candidatus Methanoperedens sp.]|nr:hypothetical protein [Candidatus Methanoperedens sp.]
MRTARAIPLLVLLLALGAFVKNPYAVSGFPLDDGWIHRVYSRSFAYGHGFCYNDGVQEAGSTSPLWAIVTAPAHWLEPLGTRAVVVAVKLVGILCALATVVAAGILAAEVSGSAIGGMVGAALLALEPRLLFSALSGMETSLLLALWASASAAAARGRHWLAAVLFGLMLVSRPEAAVLLPFVLPSLLQVHRRRGARAAAGATFLALAPALLWAVFCLHTTGHPLPNTYYVKARVVLPGMQQLELAWRSVFLHGLAPPVAFLIVAAGCTAARLRGGGLRAISVMPLLLPGAGAVAYLLAVVGSRPIDLQGYYWTRWLDPASIMFSLLFCVGCASLV